MFLHFNQNATASCSLASSFFYRDLMPKKWQLPNTSHWTVKEAWRQQHSASHSMTMGTKQGCSDISFQEKHQGYKKEQLLSKHTRTAKKTLQASNQEHLHPQTSFRWNCKTTTAGTWPHSKHCEKKEGKRGGETGCNYIIYIVGQSQVPNLLFP